MSDAQYLFLCLATGLLLSTLAVVLWDEIKHPTGRDR